MVELSADAFSVATQFHTTAQVDGLLVPGLILLALLVIAAVVVVVMRSRKPQRDPDDPAVRAEPRQKDESVIPTKDVLEDRPEMEEPVEEEDFENMSLAEIKRAKRAKVKGRGRRETAGEATKKAREEFADDREEPEEEEPEELEEEEPEEPEEPEDLEEKEPPEEVVEAEEPEEEEPEEVAEAEEPGGEPEEEVAEPEEPAEEPAEAPEELEEKPPEEPEEAPEEPREAAEAPEEPQQEVAEAPEEPQEAAEAPEEPEEVAEAPEQQEEPDKPSGLSIPKPGKPGKKSDKKGKGGVPKPSMDLPSPSKPKKPGKKPSGKKPSVPKPSLDLKKPPAKEEPAGETADTAVEEKPEEAPEVADEEPQEVAEAVEPPVEEEPEEVVEEEPEEVVEEEPEEPKSLEKGLEKTRTGFIDRLGNLFKTSELDDELVEDVEEVLFTADIGTHVAQKILDTVEEQLSADQKKDPIEVWAFIRAYCEEILRDHEGGIDYEQDKPFVMLVIGVNGVGKTTTIGKIGSKLKRQDKSVLYVAGDTFRAGAVDQLDIWAQRTDIPMHSGEEGADPSSVIYAGIERGIEEDRDVIICDTAGRLHTDSNLLDELSKMERVAGKAYDGAPHETVLVLDANTGQNAIAQAKMFDEALDISGVVLTKLDGTAKGGVILGICNQLGVPVHYIGIGEGLRDLRSFDAEEFVEALFM